MTDKNIRVIFDMLDKNGYVYKGACTVSDKITPAQARQIFNNLDDTQYPLKKFGLHYMVADLNGATLKISQIFDPETLYDEEYIMMHCTGEWCSCPQTIHKQCMQNLARGNCKNEYMRKTVGEVLFPQLYKKQKEK